MTEAEDPLATEPLLRRVRERHPEVDVVVLPDPAAAPGQDDVPPPPATPATRAAERAAVDAALDRLVAVAATVAPPHAAVDADAATRGWRSAGATGAVVPVADARLPLAGAEHGIALAEALGAALREEGWEGALRSAAPTVRLDAARDGRTARVVWLDDAVLVTVRGRALPVGTGTARALVTEGEVAR